MAAAPRSRCGRWATRWRSRSPTTAPAFRRRSSANVLEPFVRLEASRNRETGGSGLGLTLARSAAQAHGGSLELENRPEGGLIARILVPARMSAA